MLKFYDLNTPAKRSFIFQGAGKRLNIGVPTMSVGRSVHLKFLVRSITRKLFKALTVHEKGVGKVHCQRTLNT